MYNNHHTRQSRIIHILKANNENYQKPAAWKGILLVFSIWCIFGLFVFLLSARHMGSTGISFVSHY